MFTRLLRYCIIGLCLFFFVAPQIIADTPLPEEGAEILWDEWGVPHIFAADNENLFYAFGWAYMHAHGDLLLKLFAEARGQAAEYWGEDWLEGDMLVHTLNIPGQAQQAYEAQTPEFRAYLDAFAQGMNDYAAANPQNIADDREMVLPVTPQDVLANGIRSLRYVFLARAGLNAAHRWERNGGRFGSNGWAIAPSRSASGNAMLLINPHQPWDDIGLWFEAHLVSPDVEIYGASLMGSPVINVGFNPYLGWAHTVNTHDGWDLYQLTLNEDGDSYLFDGEMLPLETREVTVKVHNADDQSVGEVTFTVKSSAHGPILAYGADNTALALRVVGEGEFDAAQQWWDMGRATSFDEFQSVVARLDIPMFTVIYADRDGNIMHLFNELVPVRETGDWEFWHGYTDVEPGPPALIPGDTSALLWTEYHPYEDLPKVINPPTGWVQNANEPPWTATIPPAIDPADYPPYMAPPPYMWPRPQRSARMLYEDTSITFEELKAYKHSTYVELAGQVLDDLIAAARETDDDLLLRAADILEAWDRHVDADSVGAALFQLWFMTYVSDVGIDVYATPWRLDDPFNSASGLSDPDAAVAGLRDIARQLELLRPIGGGIDVPYGDVFRLRVGEYDLPANGGFGQMGVFRSLTFAPDEDLRFRAVQGDSFVAAVEFGETVRAEVLLSYGNSTQPHSPHVGDQLPLFAEKQLRPALLTRTDIEAHMEMQEQLIYSAVEE